MMIDTPRCRPTVAAEKVLLIMVAFRVCEAENSLERYGFRNLRTRGGGKTEIWDTSDNQEPGEYWDPSTLVDDIAEEYG
jgi:hypothetical protein